MPFTTRQELESFIASLSIPEDRRAVLRAELSDHLVCATEEARDGGLAREQAEAAGLATLGDPDALRCWLEAVEPAFRFTMREALRRGLSTSAVAVSVALVMAKIPLPAGPGKDLWSLREIWSLAELVRAIPVVMAMALTIPPGLRTLVASEMRAPRVPCSIPFLRTLSIPIGPAMTYGVLATYTPFVVGFMVSVLTQTTSEMAGPLAFSLFAAYLGWFWMAIRARWTRRQSRLRGLSA